MDKGLLIEYLKAIENPGRIGWDQKTKRWLAPTLKGYDKNQRGYGIDIVANSTARKLTNGRPGRWLTDDEVNMLMNKHIDYITGVAKRHVKGFDSFSPERQAVLLGMLYRGDSINKAVKRGLINLNEKDDRKFIDSVSKYYSTVGVSERGRSSNKFFDNYYKKRKSKNNLSLDFQNPNEFEEITPSNDYALTNSNIPSLATPPYIRQILSKGGRLLSRKLINKLLQILQQK